MTSKIAWTRSSRSMSCVNALSRVSTRTAIFAALRPRPSSVTRAIHVARSGSADTRGFAESMATAMGRDPPALLDACAPICARTCSGVRDERKSTTNSELSALCPLHDQSNAGRSSAGGLRKRAASSVCPLRAIGNDAPIAARRRITAGRLSSRIFLAHELIALDVEDAHANHDSGATRVHDADVDQARLISRPVQDPRSGGGARRNSIA